MKIAILGTRGIPNNYGGFEQCAEYLSVGLVEKGQSRLREFSDEDRLRILRDIFNAFDRKRLTWAIE